LRHALIVGLFLSFFFSSRRRHTRSKRDWSSDVCSSDLDFNLDNARQAILAFKGDVYTGLDAQSLSAEDFDYAQQHLRILSGLYRSEERRVGKECRFRWWASHEREKVQLSRVCGTYVCAV